MSHAHPTCLPHVDDLRALAIVAVPAHHLHPQPPPGGFAGVDVFFVISGLVVTASLAGDRDGRLRSFLVHFDARRVARLGAALVAILVVTVALYALFVATAGFNRPARESGRRRAVNALRNCARNAASATPSPRHRTAARC